MDIFKTDLFRWRWVGVATFRSNFLTFHLHLPGCLPEKGMGSTHVLTLNFNYSLFFLPGTFFFSYGADELMEKLLEQKNLTVRSLEGDWSKLGPSCLLFVPAGFVCQRPAHNTTSPMDTHVFILRGFVCLSLCINGCLFVCLFVSLYHWLFICLFVSLYHWLFVCLSLCINVSLFVYSLLVYSLKTF